MLNVCMPTLSDLISSLPVTWKGDTCDYTADGDLHPCKPWLKILWRLLSTQQSLLHNELKDFLIVPLMSGQLASPAYCLSQAALSSGYLQKFPHNTGYLLSELGCLCVHKHYADLLISNAAEKLPVIGALEKLSARSACPLHQLTSPDNLSQATFLATRQLLAYHLSDEPKLFVRIWALIRQCCIFEDIRGCSTHFDNMILRGQERYHLQLLSNAAWEQTVLEFLLYVYWEPVKFFTATDLQRQLLRYAKLQQQPLSEFLDRRVLGELRSVTDDRAQQLLMNTMDELARHEDYTPAYPTVLLIHGRLIAVRTLVDGSSRLLQSLFGDSKTGVMCLKSLSNYMSGSLDTNSLTVI